MKTVFILLFSLLVTTQAQAHYMWVETASQGQIGEQQEVKVYFGEYTYGVVEQVGSEAFNNMQNFTLYAVSPSGEKTILNTTSQEDHYLAYYTPDSEGTYTFYLDNNEIEVIDYTQYDFGIFKTHYHAVAKMQVGGAKQQSSINNPTGITVKSLPTDNNKMKLQVFYKGEPLAETEAVVYVKELWNKKLITDQEGFIETNLPWDTKYIVEITYKEEIPGIYKGEEYEFIWHCVTYTRP